MFFLVFLALAFDFFFLLFFLFLAFDFFFLLFLFFLAFAFFFLFFFLFLAFAFLFLPLSFFRFAFFFFAFFFFAIAFFFSAFFFLSFLIFSFINTLISAFSKPAASSSFLIPALIFFFSFFETPSSFATLSAFIFLLNFLSCPLVIFFACPGAFPFCIVVILYGLFSKVDPSLLPTRTAPGLKPSVLFLPGPISKVLVCFFDTIV